MADTAKQEPDDGNSTAAKTTDKQDITNNDSTGEKHEDAETTMATMAATTAETMTTNTKKRSLPPTTTMTSKYYAIRKSSTLKAPAIFVSWDDCSFYLEGEEDESPAEYREFDKMSDACAYIEEFLQEQKQPPLTPSRKKKKKSPASSDTKKKSVASVSKGSRKKIDEEGEDETSKGKRKVRARTSKAQEQWEEMIKLLPQFHAKYGHFDVQNEKEDPQYANMAQSLVQLKKEVEVYDKNPEKSRLTKHEYSLLDSIGYLHSLKITLPFDRKTALWKKHFLTKGTFRITTVGEGSKLYKFSKAVSDECKKIMAGESTTVISIPKTTNAADTSTKAATAAATNSTKPSESPDEEDGGEMTDGADKVPAADAGGDADSGADGTTPAATRKKGWSGPLTQLQYEHLESIGLIRWLELNPNERTIMKQHDTKLHDRWQDNFDKLHAFYKVHSRLPKKTEDSGLYYWTHRQKRMVNQRCLTENAKEQVHGIIYTPKQIGQLSMVGITFQIRRKAGLEERAQEWFDWVRANNGKHPCARIAIGKWAMDQRKKWSLWKEQGIKCNLTQEFVDRLAEGGFPWQL